VDKQVDFLDDIKLNKWVMIDINKIERLLKKGYTSKTFFKSEINVISTTTIHDDIIVRYYFDKELEIVKKFKPRCHIPCDKPIYLTQNKNERLWLLQTYLEELERMVDCLSKDILLIPQIKGIDKDEREMCYDVFNKLKLRYMSYYVAQYFGNYRGGKKGNLIKDVKELISESGLEYLMLIGVQSKDILKKLPPQVIAVAGQRWRADCELGSMTTEEVKEKFSKWKKETESELNRGQSVIGTFYIKP